MNVCSSGPDKNINCCNVNVVSAEGIETVEEYEGKILYLEFGNFWNHYVMVGL